MATRQIPFVIVAKDNTRAVLERVRASAIAAAQRQKKDGA